MTIKGRVPRSQEELTTVLAERPPGWEYLLFAGALILELEPLESNYEDYKMEYAPRLGTIIYRSQFHDYLQIQLGELRILANDFVRMFNTEALAPAFGPQGQAGDPARLLHMAKRMIGVYAELLSWVERLRGAAYPDEYQRLIGILARFADQPIEEIRKFVGDYAANAERIMDAISGGVPISIAHNLRFEISDDITEAFADEVERLRSGA